MVRYTPLLQQVIEQIFDQSKPELRDIEFRSHGFKDFLKTGFGQVLLIDPVVKVNINVYWYCFFPC